MNDLEAIFDKYEQAGSAPPAPPSRPDASELEKIASNQEYWTFGGAMQQGMMGGGGGILPKGFIKSVGVILNDAKNFAVGAVKAGVGQFVGKGTQDLITPLAKAVIAETARGAVDPKILGTAGLRFDQLQPDDQSHRLENYPVTTEIARILGEELGYWNDKQALYQKIAENPAQVLSDMASALGAAFSGGASMAGTRAPRLAKILQGMQRATEIADPVNWPGEAVTGVARGGARAVRGTDAGGFDEVSKESMTGIKPSEAAERYGAGREMTPDSALNPRPGIETREHIRGGWEGEIGAATRQRLNVTRDAIEESKKEMTDALARGVDPYNSEIAGKSVLDSYQIRQYEDKLDFNQKFQQIRAHFTEDIPTGDFNWRKNLDEVLAELDNPEINQAELEKVQSVLNSILEGREIKTLNGLDALRTEFRQRMVTQFRDPQSDVHVIGSGSMTEKVYNSITEDLYDSIEATVRGSDGRLPETLLDDVKQAKAEYRELKVLEDSPGGKFLIKHQDNPAALISGLLQSGRTALSTDEIQNVYKLIGEEGASNIQAALMNKIFQEAGTGAEGLRKKIATLNQNNPDRLAALFGGGERGREIAEDISGLADFSAMLEPAIRREKGTITARSNAMAIAGQAGGFSAIMDIARAFIWNDNPTAIAIIGGSLFGTWLTKIGRTQWMDSDWGRKRLTEGFASPEEVDAFLNAFDAATGRNVAKTAEVGVRLAGTMEDADTEQGDSEPTGGYRPTRVE